MVETRLLEGQVALVTGAGRGLGRAFAERLAALGCAVGVHGMREHGPAEYGEGTTLTDTAHAIGEAHGVRTCRVLGDLTDAAQVEHVVATVEAELGSIEILVHNAGGDIAAEGGGPIRTMRSGSRKRTCARCSSATCSRPSWCASGSPAT